MEFLHLCRASMHTQEMKLSHPTVMTEHLDGLMTLLAVARLGRYTTAANSLGVNHSTVSRRLAALERALGGRLMVRAPTGWELTDLGQRALVAAERVEEAISTLTDSEHQHAAFSGTIRLGAPDAYSVHVAAPAMTELLSRYPQLSIEIISATQRARQVRSGLDLEVVVGKPEIRHATASHMFDYSLKLYATDDYLHQHGTPQTLADLTGHPLNFYVESVLAVDDLDRAVELLPRMRRGVASTNIIAHFTATLAGAGIGLLPDYVAAQDARLTPVLHGVFEHRLSYWVVGRREALRNPAVQEVHQALYQAGVRGYSAAPIPVRRATSRSTTPTSE